MPVCQACHSKNGLAVGCTVCDSSTYLLGDIAAEATHVEAAAVARALVHLWCARLQHNEGGGGR